MTSAWQPEVATTVQVGGWSQPTSYWHMLRSPIVLAAVGVALMVGLELSRSKGSRAFGKSPTVNCQEKYCPPRNHITFVDRPDKTLMKDQSLGAGLANPPQGVTLATPYEVTKKSYLQEALTSPGVKLVCHKVREGKGKPDEIL